MSRIVAKALSIGKVAAVGLGCTVALAATSSAIADPVNPAGWLSNLPLGSPLPEGVYFIDTGAYYQRDSNGPASPRIDAIVNIPVFAWSTPVQFLGARLEALAAVPSVAVGINPNTGIGSDYFRNIYNPAAFLGLAWDLGSGWGVSDFVGTYFPVDTTVGNLLGLGGNFWTFTNIAAVSYSHDGWGVNANLVYQHSGNDNITGLHAQPDTLGLDFSVVKHIDKLELGFVAYGSTDLTTADRNLVAGRQSQIALGGLIGYTFGPVTAEIFVTRDVMESNYTGKDTRLWGRLLFPLWNPPAPPQPVVAKY
jgi:hypothetical protein